MTMQGRAGKAPKREMVIESPQQYKCLAEIEAEVEPGSQVAGVSDTEVYLKTPVQKMLWVEGLRVLSVDLIEIATSGYASPGDCMLIVVREVEHL